MASRTGQECVTLLQKQHGSGLICHEGSGSMWLYSMPFLMSGNGSSSSSSNVGLVACIAAQVSEGICACKGIASLSAPVRARLAVYASCLLAKILEPMSAKLLTQHPTVQPPLFDTHA